MRLILRVLEFINGWQPPVIPHADRLLRSRAIVQTRIR